jgi:hypothetical protein
MIIINHDSVGMVNTKITYCSKFIKCKTNQKFSNSLNMTNKNITNENYKKYLSDIQSREWESKYRRTSNIT